MIKVEKNERANALREVKRLWREFGFTSGYIERLIGRGEKEVMKFSEIELPSNRKFGFFFTLVFAVAAAYFYYSANVTWAYVFIVATLAFVLVTLINSEVLLPLNKLWIRLGILLGTIVSPIVLGIIFFGLFTPVAILMRLIGRDELMLKFTRKISHWVKRDEPITSESFKNQF